MTQNKSVTPVQEVETFNVVVNSKGATLLFRTGRFFRFTACGSKPAGTKLKVQKVIGTSNLRIVEQKRDFESCQHLNPHYVSITDVTFEQDVAQVAHAAAAFA